VNEKRETMIFMMMMLASMGPLINTRGVQDSWKQGEYRIVQIIFFCGFLAEMKNRFL